MALIKAYYDGLNFYYATSKDSENKVYDYEINQLEKIITTGK